jgi:hypothetical protein
MMGSRRNSQASTGASDFYMYDDARIKFRIGRNPEIPGLGQMEVRVGAVQSFLAQFALSAAKFSCVLPLESVVTNTIQSEYRN